MKSIYITIQGEEIHPYSNLSILVDSLDMKSKYSTIYRAINSTGKAVIGELEIRKLYMVRRPQI